MANLGETQSILIQRVPHRNRKGRSGKGVTIFIFNTLHRNTYQSLHMDYCFLEDIMFKNDGIAHITYFCFSNASY